MTRHEKKTREDLNAIMVRLTCNSSRINSLRQTHSCNDAIWYTDN